MGERVRVGVEGADAKDRHRKAVRVGGFLVEPKGVEPSTSGVRFQRSPS